MQYAYRFIFIAGLINLFLTPFVYAKKASSAYSVSHKKQHTNSNLLNKKTPLGPKQKKDSAILVLDLDTHKQIYSKNSTVVKPIASLTKVMTYLVDNKLATQYKLNPDSVRIQVSSSLDADRIRHTSFKLEDNKSYSLDTLRYYYLTASNNNAAMAVARYWNNILITPDAFSAEMNNIAKQLGMTRTFFKEPTGLETKNVSSAVDLGKLLSAAYRAPNITKYSTQKILSVQAASTPNKNTNALIRDMGQTPLLSKTGFIKESGFNLLYVPDPKNCQNKHYGIVLLGFSTPVERTQQALKLLKSLNCTV